MILLQTSAFNRIPVIRNLVVFFTSKKTKSGPVNGTIAPILLMIALVTKSNNIGVSLVDLLLVHAHHVVGSFSAIQTICCCESV
jgi:hypothetical protein